MWGILSEWNWELIIALGALALSIYTFYEQNLKEEIAIYPSDKDKVFFVTIENTGKSSIRGYTIQIVKVEHANSQLEELMNNMFLINRKAEFSLSSNKTTSFTVGSTARFINGDHLPILTFDVYNNKKRKVDTFVCDFNMYRHQIEITITSSKENQKARTIKRISKSLDGIHTELINKNRIE
ncbi:hypothetical protein RIF24_16430 (plasmid) [Exiguobacterium acetylicum]|uniref:hypothetical protein n=1 Tax=Exiguobacterium acetylicum TaxID=41170 RepID=UPI00397741C5